MILHSIADPQVSRALIEGSLVVLKTDTVYGILARAADPEATKKLYLDRPRSPQKGCIILISSIDDIPGLSAEHKSAYLELLSVRPTTLIAKAPSNYLTHLVRQHGTLAFRLISSSCLVELISKTGPLLAPSANPENLPIARNINEAVAYFGDKVSIYVDGGEVQHAMPSKIIAINDSDEIEIMRD